MYGIDFVKKLKRRNIGGSKRSSEKLFGRRMSDLPQGPQDAAYVLSRAKKRVISSSHSSCRTLPRTTVFGWNGEGSIAVGAPFGIGRPVDDSAQLAPETCPGTHHARLDGHIELAFGQILSPDGRGGGRDSLHFGMSRSVPTASRPDYVLDRRCGRSIRRPLRPGPRPARTPSALRLGPAA